jgi:Alpha-tubulin suppressor and related RCC1 domain-containing proteins
MLIKTDGSLWGIGWNDYGALGSGNTVNPNKWVKITDNVRSVSAGYQHTLILKSDNTVWATGRNIAAELGDGTRDLRSSFVKVSDNARAIYAGTYASFIIKSDNSLWAAGSDADKMISGGKDLGMGKYITPFTRIMDNVTAVASGTDHTVILKMDGTVVGAGSNRFSQLGMGSFDEINTFTQIADNVKAIATGRAHTLLLKNDNTVWACGFNSNGQIGVSNQAFARNFIKVADNAAAIAAAKEGDNSFILKTAEPCWGQVKTTMANWAMLAQ